MRDMQKGKNSVEDQQRNSEEGLREELPSFMFSLSWFEHPVAVMRI